MKELVGAAKKRNFWYKSSEHGLEQDFNSLDAQREAAEAYIKSQAHEGWRLVKARYDMGVRIHDGLVCTSKPAAQGHDAQRPDWLAGAGGFEPAHFDLQVAV